MTTRGDTRPIPELPPEAVSRLYDGSNRVAYAIAIEIVEGLRRDPAPMLEHARHWLERHSSAYPPDRMMWVELLNGPVEDLCRQLLRLDDRGELLRDTMPSFGAMDEDRRMAIARATWSAARGPGDTR